MIAELGMIRPNDPVLRSVWPTLLSVISEDDDLGAAPITLDELGGGRPGPKLRILAASAEHAVRVEAKEALKKRPAHTDARLVRVHVTTNRRGRQPRVELRTSKRDRTPAVSIELLFADGQLEIVSRVTPLRPRRLQRAAAKSQKAAVARLERHRFAPEDRGAAYARSRPLPVATDDLRELIAAEMADDVRVIVVTGILDYDA